MSIVCGKRYANHQEALLDDGKAVYWPHRIGRNILLCGKKSSRFPFQCFVGPDWPCMVVTYTLMVVPSILFCWNIGTYFHPVVIAIEVVLVIISLILFSLTACSDPGIVFTKPKDFEDTAMEKGESNTEELFECGLCQIMRPKNAYHCHDCGVCIVELDHHCPWTGKCIGKKTIKTFFGFIWAIGILVAYVVLMVVITAAMGNNVAKFET